MARENPVYVGRCNKKVYEIFKYDIPPVKPFYIALCDGWHQTEAQPTLEMARHAARIWLTHS